MAAATSITVYKNPASNLFRPTSPTLRPLFSYLYPCSSTSINKQFCTSTIPLFHIISHQPVKISTNALSPISDLQDGSTIAYTSTNLKHKFVQVNEEGLKLHVVETGNVSSPAVIFLHGFPEIWYSWRYQLAALGESGFRAIAFDYRGYGLSDQPPEPGKTTFSDLVADLHALLHALSIPKAFVVGKDLGARIAYLFALHHPEKVLGIVSLVVPFLPPKPLTFHESLPEGLYITRFQEPGRAEADFGRFDSKTIIRNIYILYSGTEIPIAKENQEVMDMVDPSTPLPPWFTDEDLAVFASSYDKSGFQTALAVPYRSFPEDFTNIANVKVEAPALHMIGEKDYFLKFGGMDEYIKSEKAKMFVPKLETVVVPQGTRFMHEQMPDQVNQIILGFLNNNMS